MDAFSNYYENKIIDHMLRGEAFSAPSNIYIALFTTNTGLESNSPSGEVSTTNTDYSRKEVTLSSAANGSSYNTSDVTWNVATSNWGTVTAAAIVDHPTNTNWGNDVNVLMWADLTTPKTVNNEDLFKILSTKFIVTVS